MENISCSDSRTDHNAVLYFVFFLLCRRLASSMLMDGRARRHGTSSVTITTHIFYFILWVVYLLCLCLLLILLLSKGVCQAKRLPPHLLVSCVLFVFLFSGWGPGDESKQSGRMDEIGKWDAMSSHIRPKSTVPLENTAVLPSRFLLTHGERRHPMTQLAR